MVTLHLWNVFHLDFSSKYILMSHNLKKCILIICTYTHNHSNRKVNEIQDISGSIALISNFLFSWEDEPFTFSAYM